MINISAHGVGEIIFMDRELQGCELAITDKAKCITCKRKIAQGTPRIWVFGELRKPPPDEGIEKIKRFICHRCSMAIIDEKEKDYMRDIEKGEIAKAKLNKQMEIKTMYYNYLKNDKIIKKIINDDIIYKLEDDYED